jgi:hypothetical protein
VEFSGVEVLMNVFFVVAKPGKSIAILLKV